MKILIASPYLPWPLNQGGNAAQFSALQCLAQDHQFTLVCPVTSEAQMRFAQELATRLPEVQVRAVNCTPQASDPVLIKQLRPLVQVLRSRLRSATSRGRSPAAPFYPFNLLRQPFIEALQAEVDKSPDLFQAEFAEMMPLAAWLPVTLPRLFVHHQIHFVYAQRHVATYPLSAYLRYMVENMKVQEMAYLRPYDGVITFSERDSETLRDAGLAAVHTSPFPIPSDVGIAANPAATFDGRFVFIGSEVHGPNRDSLEWLITDIWPGILAGKKDAQLTVIGDWSKSWAKTHQAVSVSYTGFVKDLAAVLRGGIMLVPLKVGSGIRTKILVSLAQGVPLVTTSVGMEGLPLRDSEHVLIRDEAAAFAAAALDLAKRPELWTRLAVAGLSVAKQYAPEYVRQRRNAIYDVVVAAGRRRAASVRVQELHTA